MHRMIIFDDGLGRFGPMTDLRASFEIRTGVCTTAGRLAAARPKTLAGYWTSDRLQPLVAARANAPVNRLPDEEELLCVNGRWALPDTQLNLKLNEVLTEKGTGHVIAALFRRADAKYFLTTGQLHERVTVREFDQRVLYRRPWDILAMLENTLPHDLAASRMHDAKLTTTQASLVGEHAVEVHESARVFPYVVFDATRGPIRVDRSAIIRPGVVLCGPCAIGRECTIVDHALIKSNTAIGPVCKVGGEVGGTIFQGYTNKAHDGHLGDSWVGKWVNFGAGTTNSNLLNTYGEVSMRIDPDGPRQRTGQTFLGAIVGDQVKFAINTRIMTGSVFGTGSMIATSTPPPTATRRFAWLTDDGSRRYRFDKFIETMHKVMARREKSPGEEYISALRNLYEHSQQDLLNNH